MKNFFFCIYFTLFSCCIIYGQTTTGYITHTIKPGETLTLLSKQYKTTVGDIMRLNHMNTQSILSIGEVVKIPVHTTVAKVVTSPPIVTPPAITPSPIVDTITSATGKPITHIVGKGESLYTLSKKYKTTIPQLKAWNNLKSNLIIDGHSLIVGYTAGSMVSLPIVPPAQSPVKQESVVAQSLTQTQPVIADTAASQPMQTNTQADVPVDTIQKSTDKVILPPVAKATTITDPIDASKISPEGYFISSFGLGTEGRSLETMNGTSMTFKTTSGWNDKKYYILINNVPPGSIVKVMANGKDIYAKVLWGMTSMKENEGLDFRISTAAAAALGLSDSKFPLSVTYFE